MIKRCKPIFRDYNQQTGARSYHREYPSPQPNHYWSMLICAQIKMCTDFTTARLRTEL